MAAVRRGPSPRPVARGGRGPACMLSALGPQHSAQAGRPRESRPRSLFHWPSSFTVKTLNQEPPPMSLDKRTPPCDSKPCTLGPEGSAPPRPTRAGPEAASGGHF